VTELLFDLLELPHWSARLIFGLLVVGFPLVLLFSWVYELTPEGLRKQHEVDRDQSITHETGRKINYLIGALAVLAIIVVAVDRFIPRTAPGLKAKDVAAVSTPATGSPVHAAAKSIAVLPFVNMSGDAGNEYFADGLSEELLNLLAKMPELRVAARTSAFKVKGEKINVQEVAQKLNVAHVLEGSVRKSGNKVRITAQLIKAHDTFQATGRGGVQPRLARTFFPRAARPGGPRAFSRLLPAVARARSRLRPGMGGSVAGIRTAGRLRCRAGRGRLSAGARGRGEGAGA